MVTTSNTTTNVVCRDGQMTLLRNLLHPEHCHWRGVYVTGPPNTGKTTCVRLALRDTIHAYVDCQKLFNERLICGAIAKQLRDSSGLSSSSSSSSSSASSSSSSTPSVYHLMSLSHDLESNATLKSHMTTGFVVLDRLDALAKSTSNSRFLDGLFRLAESAQIRLCFVLISTGVIKATRIVPNGGCSGSSSSSGGFSSSSLMTMMIPVPFSAYSTDELVEICMLRVLTPQDISEMAWKKLLRVVIEGLQYITRDLGMCLRVAKMIKPYANSLVREDVKKGAAAAADNRGSRRFVQQGEKGGKRGRGRGRRRKRDEDDAKIMVVGNKDCSNKSMIDGNKENGSSSSSTSPDEKEGGLGDNRSLQQIPSSALFLPSSSSVRLELQTLKMLVRHLCDHAHTDATFTESLVGNFLQLPQNDTNMRNKKGTTIHSKLVAPAATSAGRDTAASSPLSSEGMIFEDVIMQLPTIASYIIFAAFLAAHNPASTDKLKFSAEVDQPRRKRRRRRKLKKLSGGKKSSSIVVSPLLSGPKSFELSRMIAIFDHIFDNMEDHGQAVVHTLTSSLVSLKLLSQMERSSSSKVDCFQRGLKLYCNVGYQDVQKLAKSLDFSLENFLYDPEAEL